MKDIQNDFLSSKGYSGYIHIIYITYIWFLYQDCGSDYSKEVLMGTHILSTMCSSALHSPRASFLLLVGVQAASKASLNSSKLLGCKRAQ